MVKKRSGKKGFSFKLKFDDQPIFKGNDKTFDELEESFKELKKKFK